MQIDRYNHLLFPRENPSNAAGGNDASATSATGAGTASNASRALPPAADPAPARADSVVLQIRSSDAAPVRPETVLYTATGQPDFVSVAVSAMRELRDQTERQQATQPSAANAAPAQTSSGWMQSLAARFKAFA
jgi:hypothetical protein